MGILLPQVVSRGGGEPRSLVMDSSLIRGARYWPDHRALEICLAGGRRYLYLGVPETVIQGFTEAASKGGYFNRYIRGRFDCHALKDEEALQQRAVND